MTKTYITRLAMGVLGMLLTGAGQAVTTYRCTDAAGRVTVTHDGCGPDTVTMDLDDGMHRTGPVSLTETAEAGGPSPLPAPAAAPAPVRPDRSPRQEPAGGTNDVTASQVAAMVYLIKFNGYRCDSVTNARPCLWSCDYVVSCNSARYRYNFKDVGGNWVITVE